ncbi:MAG: LLM class flavin-dependent oxidoreductase [Planctomycetota bacterium]
MNVQVIDPIASEQHTVVRHAANGRYSVWPAGETPSGNWVETDFHGTQEQCFDAITDWANGDEPCRSQPSAKPSVKTDGDSTPSTVNLSLMFFGDQQDDPTGDRYRLFFEAAQFADQHGFSGIWVPERHFTKFGCLYPSPAVLHAALARETDRIRLRAGSVVMPLHDPVEVAESWAMVDNLSGGRVDVAFASGWHPNDFALAPDHYEDRHTHMHAGIEEVQKLWRGETVARRNGVGESIDVGVYPTPVQQELPVWMTIAGNPDSFVLAGQKGYHIVTHLFNQNVEDLAANIQRYRDAWASAGHNRGTQTTNEGQVSVAMHTLVGRDLDTVRRHAEQPYCDYLRSNLGLLKNLAISNGRDAEIDSLSEPDREAMLHWMFDKFLGRRSLLGTPDTCRKMLTELEQIGVTEIACLLDFGPTREAILECLPLLASLCAPDDTMTEQNNCELVKPHGR